MEARRGFPESESESHQEDMITAGGYQRFSPPPNSDAGNNLHDSGAASFCTQNPRPAIMAIRGYQPFSPPPPNSAAANNHHNSGASFPNQHPNSAIWATGGYQAFSPPPLNGNHHRPRLDAASVPTGNHQLDSAIWATGGYQPFSPPPLNGNPNHRHHLTAASFLPGNHQHPNSTTLSAAGDRLSSAGFITTARQINATAVPRYADTATLESQLSALRLAPTPRAAPPPYDDINYSLPIDYFLPRSQLRDLQQMRIQSAAQQLGSSYAQINPNFDGFDQSIFYSSAINPNRYQSLANSFNSTSNYGLGVERFFNSSPNFFNSNPNYSGNYNGHGSFQKRSSPRVRIQTNNFTNPRWNVTSVQELRGNIFLISKDQQGCRFLQRKLQEGDPDDVHMIFMELKHHICELMLIQFGNLLIHDLLDACSQDQITQLLLKVIHDEHRFKDICVHPQGTRSIQKLLEFLTTQEQRSHAISVLRRITLPLTKSVDGHHIIMSCLKNFSLEDNMHILNEVADNCIEIALDQSGCCVLQQCVANATGEARDRLIAEITSNALRLSDHPFGNYVVQYILGLGIPRATGDILAQLSGHIVSLSMSKYGSNVVEKFLKGEQVLTSFVDPIIEEIVSSPDVLSLVQDPFGNFVAQSAFAASKGAMHSAMVTVIHENYAHLHSHPNGKRVLSCLKGKSRG